MVVLVTVPEEGRTILLDGFPLSEAQAQLLEEQLYSPDGMLLLACPEDVMIQRVLTRGKSPIDGRSDDRNMSVLARITQFRYACAPVMERYRKIMAVTDADGTTVDEVRTHMLVHVCHGIP